MKDLVPVERITSKIYYSKSVRPFTEQGVPVLSSVLNSKRAIQVNIKTAIHGGNTP
jgi:hypothetical protein